MKGGTELLKKKANGLNKFPNAPEKMLVWNDDVDELENFDKVVDINWYYQLINKKLEAWL